jgi:hypothetical protein
MNNLVVQGNITTNERRHRLFLRIDTYVDRPL